MRMLLSNAFLRCSARRSNRPRTAQRYSRKTSAKCTLLGCGGLKSGSKQKRYSSVKLAWSLTTPGRGSRGGRGGRSLAKIAPRVLGRAHQQMFEAAPFFTALSPERRHRVRILAKRLRYAAFGADGNRIARARARDTDIGALVLRATVTDADGDVATHALDLSAGVFSLRDDGPSITAASVAAGTQTTDT